MFRQPLFCWMEGQSFFAKALNFTNELSPNSDPNGRKEDNIMKKALILIAVFSTLAIMACGDDDRCISAICGPCATDADCCEGLCTAMYRSNTDLFAGYYCIASKDTTCNPSE